MAKILITSGPTRQYLDPVRYISNGSSGKMGSALAESALARGHHVTIVSGPVDLEYSPAANVIQVVSTAEMLAACREQFPGCDGVIAAAAPCDYRPKEIATEKIRKSGSELRLSLVETEDILAELSHAKRPGQCSVGVALETDDGRARAVAKLHRKRCDLIVLNGVTAIDANANSVEIIGVNGDTVATAEGTKLTVAAAILSVIENVLIDKPPAPELRVQGE